MPLLNAIPESEEQPTFLTFLRDVFWGWAGLMTGGLIGIGLIIYGVAGGILTPLIFAFVGIIAGFVACYMLWRDERLKRFLVLGHLVNEQESVSRNLSAISHLEQNLLEEKNKRTPLLEATGSLLAVGTASNGIQSLTALTFQLSIYNQGMPSIATGWKLELTLPEKEPFYSVPHQIASDNEGAIKLSDVTGNGGIELHTKDYIFNKTLTPIPTGGMVTGVLLFLVPFKIEEVSQKGTKAKVLFKDIKGKLSSFEADTFTNRSPTANTVGFHPGIDIKNLKKY